MKLKFACIASVLLLQGCSAAIVAGTAGAVTSATDRRTLGTQIDDNNLEIKATLALKDDDQLAKFSNIIVVSLNGRVLLIGQTPTTEMRAKAESIVKPIQGVKKIHNQIRIGNITGISTKTHDTWLTSKVKTMLVSEEKISANNIKVITENGEVFLMGLVTETEANLAANIARHVSGVEKVIKVFEYL
ncbi:division/outer membrane stress-associated lipid-binding lipoprotein [Pseudoalteromonas sp.]|uniref:division/outer membrane stress-associated lipid-binding lipoprotein n=1 Tax=Pseudoalteromonas sp. TaxID=53249 RepID=UPI00356A0623